MSQWNYKCMNCQTVFQEVRPRAERSRNATCRCGGWAAFASGRKFIDPMTAEQPPRASRSRPAADPKIVTGQPTPGVPAIHMHDVKNFRILNPRVEVPYDIGVEMIRAEGGSLEGGELLSNYAVKLEDSPGVKVKGVKHRVPNGRG